MKRYNHMYSLAFSVVNNSENGEHTTPAEVREAIFRRLAAMTDGEVLEAIGYPEDTYEEGEA